VLRGGLTLLDSDSIDPLLDSRYFQQCFQNCQGYKNCGHVECPESNVAVGIVCLKVLHSASLGLVDGCNVIVLPGISANQIDSEGSGGREVVFD